MLDDNIKNRRKINMLVNVNNIFGNYEKQIAPFIKCIILSSIPILLYLMIFNRIFTFKALLLFEIPYSIFVALCTIGRRKERLEQYRASRNDIYSNFRKIIRLSNFYDNGIIEYQNGRIAVILSGFTKTYISDMDYEKDMSNFLSRLDKYDYDIHIHTVIGENTLLNNSECLSVYKNNLAFMRERLDLYKVCDDYVNENCVLFRYNYIIKSQKYNWKDLLTEMEEIVKSSSSTVFSNLHIVTDKTEQSDIMGRDVCSYVSVTELIQSKFINEEYNNSEVLFYGNDVPSEYIEEKEDTTYVGRRVIIND